MFKLVKEKRRNILCFFVWLWLVWLCFTLMLGERSIGFWENFEEEKKNA